MKVIGIHSYKGGAGKTTIAINLAVQLATEKAKRILLIEFDFLMPSFYEIFKEITPKYYFNDFFKEPQMTLRTCITAHPTISNLDLIFANPTFNPNEKIHSWDKSYHAYQLRRLQTELNQIRDSSLYDFVIFDTPPGLSFVAINMIGLASHVVVVVRPNSHAIKGTKNLVENLYFKTKSPQKLKVLLLYNQIPRVKMTAELNQWNKEFEKLYLKQIARIPCSCEGTYAMAIGQHIFDKTHEINRYMQPLLQFLNEEEIISIPDPTY